jgi:hypothetical protein
MPERPLPDDPLALALLAAPLDEDPVDGIDDGPSSEVRPIEPKVRKLVVDTGLRGAAAEGACVTITDSAGTVCFEGAPGADGCVQVSFDSAPRADRVQVLFETATLHRQAEITLRDGWTTHAFA